MENVSIQNIKQHKGFNKLFNFVNAKKVLGSNIIAINN